MKFVKFKKGFLRHTSRISPNTLPMRSFQDCVCYGIVFLLSWRKKTKSSYTVSCVKVHVQKTTKPPFYGSVTVALFIR